MEGKRLANILADVSRRMKADDIAGNTKMLETIVRREVDEIVKAIQRDVGVKLPASEVSKILKLKMENLSKDIKNKELLQVIGENYES